MEIDEEPREDDAERETVPLEEPRPREPAAPQLIWVNEHEIALPPGVTVADWALERIRDQNPRIRALLGCTRLLGEVLESNYTLLHCSPERLVEVWRRARRVADLLRNEVRPLLRTSSCIAELEAARVRASEALDMLERNVLDNLEQFPETLSSDQVLPVRKLLCVSLGKINAFLQNAFGDLVAHDPRSLHDADYFLSRRFPKDIEEAEWLFVAVHKLKTFLNGLESQRLALLRPLVEHLRREQRLPDEGLWQPARGFFERLTGNLAPRLREVLALRGIRFNELEILDRYSIEIPILCRLVLEIQLAGRDGLAVLADAPPSMRLALDRAISQRLLTRVEDIDAHLRDLVAFIPLWIRGLEQRRALLLHRSSTDGAGKRPRREETKPARPQA